MIILEFSDFGGWMAVNLDSNRRVGLDDDQLMNIASRMGWNTNQEVNHQEFLSDKMDSGCEIPDFGWFELQEEEERKMQEEYELEMQREMEEEFEKE